MADLQAASIRPDGIDADQVERGRDPRSGSSVLSLVVLGLVVAIGLCGLAGERSVDLAVDNAAGRLELRVPSIVRSGNVIETRLHFVARQPVAKLVVAIEPELWRQITTNSIEPAAASEEFSDGMLRLSFDKLEAGQAFDLQFAQQINPALFGTNRGRIVVLDEQRQLAELAIELRVLP